MQQATTCMGWKSANETESLCEKPGRLIMHHVPSHAQALTEKYVSRKRFQWTVIIFYKIPLFFRQLCDQPFGLQIQESMGTWAPPRVKITWIIYDLLWLINQMSNQRSKTGTVRDVSLKLPNRRNDSEAALTNDMNRVFLRQRYT